MKIWMKILIAIILVIGVIWFLFRVRGGALEQELERNNYYQEWCPKLNAKPLIERGFGFSRRCYRVLNNQTNIRYYRISEIGEDKFLVEEDI